MPVKSQLLVFAWVRDLDYCQLEGGQFNLSCVEERIPKRTQRPKHRKYLQNLGRNPV